jgi:predicted N-acyltransferase
VLGPIFLLCFFGFIEKLGPNIVETFLSHYINSVSKDVKLYIQKIYTKNIKNFMANNITLVFADKEGDKTKFRFPFGHCT